MSAVLDTVKTVWEIFKDGGRTSTAGTTVNVLPSGSSVMDIPGWQGPVSYPEKYDELSSIFQSELADFTLTPNWQYSGQYIANFNVIVDGTVDVLSSVDVSATTFEATMNSDDVVEMQYHIEVKFHNVTGGTRLTNFKGLARGDGGGMNIA